MNESEWETIAEQLQQLPVSSNLIYGYWADEERLYLEMGRDPWKSTRRDRFSGSRVWNTANNDALDSADRMQLIEVMPQFDGDAMDVDVNEADEGLTCERQTMAHFLRASLRLGPVDVLTVTNLLASNRMN